MLKEDVVKGASILGSHLILCIENINNNEEKHKDRFVVHCYTDRENNALVHAPKVRKQMVKMLVAIAAIHWFRLWTQDVT